MKTVAACVTGVVATAVLGSGLALAAGKPAEQPAASVGTTSPAPKKIEGRVVSIDARSGMVTLRAADGQTHQFRGNEETLKDLKVGDRLELTLRQPAR